jgi:hypothetical protein
MAINYDLTNVEYPQAKVIAQGTTSNSTSPASTKESDPLSSFMEGFQKSQLNSAQVEGQQLRNQGYDLSNQQDQVKLEALQRANEDEKNLRVAAAEGEQNFRDLLGKTNPQEAVKYDKARQDLTNAVLDGKKKLGEVDAQTLKNNVEALGAFGNAASYIETAPLEQRPALYEAAKPHLQEILKGTNIKLQLPEKYDQTYNLVAMNTAVGFSNQIKQDPSLMDKLKTETARAKADPNAPAKVDPQSFEGRNTLQANRAVQGVNASKLGDMADTVAILPTIASNFDAMDNLVNKISPIAMSRVAQTTGASPYIDSKYAELKSQFNATALVMKKVMGMPSAGFSDGDRNYLDEIVGKGATPESVKALNNLFRTMSQRVPGAYKKAQDLYQKSGGTKIYDDADLQGLTDRLQPKGNGAQPTAAPTMTLLQKIKAERQGKK